MSRPPAKAEIEEGEEAFSVEVLEPLFRPDKRDLGVQIVTTMVQRIHSGPLPAPETFAHYEQIHPGAAERILTMAENEQSHRHGRENRIITNEFGIRYAGQAGAILALILLCGSVIYCASIGRDVAAGVIGAVGVIVTAFLRYTQMQMDKEPEEKAPQPSAKRGQKPKPKR